MTFNPVPKPKKYCRCGCGEVVNAGRKYISGHNLKRRPKDAIVKGGRLYKKVVCDECGVEFERRADAIGKVKFCGFKCRGKWQTKERTGRPNPKARTGTNKKCKECGSEFYVVKYRVINENVKFCSQKCYAESLRKTGNVPYNFMISTNNKGKNNGMYKHGKYKRKGAPSKAKLRNEIIERDGGNWCLFCGKPGPGLHLHRIKYGSQGGKYEIDNCVQLCVEDHALVHSSKNKYMPILLDHINNKTLFNDGSGLNE